MLLTILSGWLFVEKRRIVQVFPEPVRKLWNDWELRIMVLISLTLQMLLIVMGNRRKYNPGTWLRFSIWSAYLMADWVATVALGVLSNKQGNSCTCAANKTETTDAELMAFWAPFLLLHLGGPDTITAYALADNELWIRHFLGLVVQTIVALYVTVTAWSGTWLSFLTIPMLFTGVIKYGERSLALRSANREQFLDSLLEPPDPGPSYAKFMEEFTLKKCEGFSVLAIEVIEEADQSPTRNGNNDGAANSRTLLLAAYNFFQTFKRLFVDLILSFQDRDHSQSYFKDLSSEYSFKLVEIELGFAYDVFYTKAPIIYTTWGCILRIISPSLTIIVLVVFLFVDKGDHLLTDLVISYILLLGAIILEFYAVILLLYSDRAKLWWSKHPKICCFGSLVSGFQCMVSPVSKFIPPMVSRMLSYSLPSNKMKWSNSLAQYNLLSFALQDNLVPCLEGKRDLFIKIVKHIPTLEKRLHRYRCSISPELKSWIFEHFLRKSKDTTEKDSKDKSEDVIASLCSARGNLVFEQNNCFLLFKWTTELEFDQSILVWHVATDLCYHSDEVNDSAVKCWSKNLSDYMLYLLVMCPFMLPIGIGMIRFRDTCEEAKQFYKEKGLSFKDESHKTKLYEMLLAVSTEVLPTKVKGDRSKSVLFNGCRLAHELLKMDREKKWEFVCDVWIEMLGYAASQCRGYYHAQQLMKGGELLTHVWLLMAHLGITQQFQINRGHARAKLAVY
ncbi:hypothetical protein I3760_07G135200 [Carya illinoinensis]|nr:hypothetical protein I3760_07G135200 [Carya illinoinensis]